MIVDEGQDLHAGHWRILRGLVAPGPNDLFLCEDGHQRIYGDRLVLSRLGIETRGRSRRLTLNYRTSRQNLAFALGVIGAEKVVDLDGDEETVAGYRSTFRGPVPVTRGFPSVAEEMRFVVRDRQGLAGRRRRPVVDRRARPAVAGTGPGPARPAGGRRRRGAAAARRPGEQPGRSRSRPCTGPRAPSSPRVIVVGAEAGVVPLDWVIESQPEADHPAIRGRERSLFYVACSRARDELVVTWAGAPSPFIPSLSA